MSILFIAHGKRTKPQGLVDMTTFLRMRGHEADAVHVYDNLRAIGKLPHEPTIVGLSVHTENAGRIRQVVGIVRQRWPLAKIAIGGPHINSDVLEKEPEYADLADWLVIGEGEYAMLEILDGREPSVIHGTPLSQDDFAQLPMPTPDDIMRLFRFRREAVLINRGCPFSCSFCHANRKRIVYRHPGRVAQYLATLDKTLGKRQWFVQDDVFAVNKKWLAEFVVEREKIGNTTSLRCFIHGHTFDEERLDLLRRAGVRQISLGAESGDDGVLALANKGTTLADYERIHAMFRRQRDAKLHCLWMLGLPGETPETMRSTLDAAKRIGQLPPNFGFATPYPGTRFYKTASEHGTIIEPDWHKWTPSRISFVANGVTVPGLRAAMRQGKAMGHP